MLVRIGAVIVLVTALEFPEVLRTPFAALIGIFTIVGFELVARPPQISISWERGTLLVIATLVMLVAAASALWRATRFN